MIAFASNSLLCRAALKQTNIDAATFTLIRVISGAVALWLVTNFAGRWIVARIARPVPENVTISRYWLLSRGNWISALALFVYASAFSFAYIDFAGTTYATISGAITSGIGYVIWYSALPGLKAASAATVQLSVPVLAAAGGILLLGEPMTLRYLLASIAVLGGIALVVVTRHS